MIKHTLVYTDRIDESEELEIHTVDEFSKLDKFIGNETFEFRTTYSKEGSEFKVHSHAFNNGIEIDGTAISDDMYKSVDMLVAKLESQFRKEKGKRTNIDRNVNVQTEEETE